MLAVNEKTEKRGRFEIMSAILSSCRGRMMRKTNIMYQCNLSYRELRKYLSLLTSLGHLEVKRAGDTDLYRITDKGRTFLREYQHLKKMLKEKRPPSHTEPQATPARGQQKEQPR